MRDSGKLENYKQNAKSQKKKRKQIKCLNFLQTRWWIREKEERERERGEENLEKSLSMWISSRYKHVNFV